MARGFSHAAAECLVVSDSPAARYFGIQHPILNLPCLNYFMRLALIPKVPLNWESTEVATSGRQTMGFSLSDMSSPAEP